jgi:hypothetical protein
MDVIGIDVVRGAQHGGTSAQPFER